MRAQLQVALPGVILVALLIFYLLLRALFRTRMGTHCFSCGSSKVRPSYAHGLGDSLARLAFLAPYRCSGCLVRHYRFAWANRKSIRVIRYGKSF
jgi:hypothetical protein